MPAFEGMTKEGVGTKCQIRTPRTGGRGTLEPLLLLRLLLLAVLLA